MFSLIVTVIAIALAALLVAATLFFGGDIIGKGRPDAQAARYINEAQQISGAIRTYQSEKSGSMPESIEGERGLVPVYLKSMPKAGVQWDFSSGVIANQVSDKTTCERINVRAGLDPEPLSCDSVPAGTTYFCCVRP